MKIRKYINVQHTNQIKSLKIQKNLITKFMFLKLIHGLAMIVLSLLLNVCPSLC